MAEWTGVAVQTVNPGESIIFTDNSEPCNRGLILHKPGSGSFLLKGTPNNSVRCCGCPSVVNYDADFGANIAIPEGETAGAISVAFAIDGVTLAGTEMEATPSAVGEFANVSRATKIPIWYGCCQTVSIRNTSSIPIQVKNANVIFSR